MVPIVIIHHESMSIDIIIVTLSCILSYFFLIMTMAYFHISNIFAISQVSNGAYCNHSPRKHENRKPVEGSSYGEYMFSLERGTEANQCDLPLGVVCNSR